jgi:hypothetical protein
MFEKEEREGRQGKRKNKELTKRCGMAWKRRREKLKNMERETSIYGERECGEGLPEAHNHYKRN